MGFVSHAQPTQHTEISKAYDALIGPENTELYTGPQFQDGQRNAWDGSHIYLTSPNYQTGTVVYRDQEYLDVSLKYDLFEDQVSIQSPEYLPTFRIKLIPAYISGFSLHGHQFVNLKDQTQEQGNGFYEIAMIGKNISFFIKHRKKKKRETVDRVLQYRFEEDNHYLLQFRQKFHTIFSLRDLKALFPERYEDIRHYRRLNRSLAKHQPDEFMIKLATYLDEKLNQ